MNSYTVKITPQAYADIDNALRYFKLTSQAIKNIKKDIRETKNKLKFCAGSMSDYKDNSGRKMIHLASHAYIFIYSIDGSIVEIEEFVHDLQNE